MRVFALLVSSPIYLIPALAILVLAATLYAIVLRWRTEPAAELNARVLGGCVFAGTMLSSLASRADLLHLVHLSPLYVYLVPSLFHLRHNSTRRLYRARPVLGWLLLCVFTAFGLVSLLPALSAKHRLQTCRGSVRTGYEDEVVPYVRRALPAGAHLYLHPYQSAYLFLTGATNPTRFDFLMPGMATADQYRSAIEDLERDRTPAVLFNLNFSLNIPNVWPEAPLSALAADPVADYILAHYRTCKVLNHSPEKLWTFYYMVRRDLPCPDEPGPPAGR
jgi:hypothetical protein